MSGEREAECAKTLELYQLFVGGSLDGMLMPVNGLPARYEWQTPATRAGEAQRMVVDEYILEPIAVEGRVLMHLYRHTGMCMVDVLVRLMGAYVVMKH